MLLTITYEGKQTQDLGYLLYKNPYRAQSFELSFGKAYVFYPEVSEERTTAALLLDINPVDLARGKPGTQGDRLFDYVNDRPYVASSFMSTALAKVFGKAMSGKCEKKQQLADTPLALTACIHTLPCKGKKELIAKIFEPLGYSVELRTSVLDEKFPEWGESPYLDLTVSGTVTLSALLNHLYVLIPVFDRQKHYYVSEDEIEKLMKHGEGWLAQHPARDIIINRYFYGLRSYAHKAMDRLTVSLNEKRLEAVRNAVIESGATSVIDLGCGEGKLTAMLLEEKQIRRVGAVDVSVSALEKAKQYLHYDKMLPYKKEKLTLMQGSLTYKDTRFFGYDAACVVEVIEHFDPQRIPAFERVLFEFSGPKTVIVTTPNREYNARYAGLAGDSLRHSDHRFEWSRKEFAEWTKHICGTFGYTVEIREIGDADEEYGAPTQMGVFRKCV